MKRWLAVGCSASLLLVVGGCGSVSGLSRESAHAAASIADFDRVEVIDFELAPDETTSAETDEAVAKRLLKAEQARHDFADKIADAITTSAAFADVVREPGDGPALRVSGIIRRYDEGNIVARGLTGFAGQSHFDATVTVSDARRDVVLATLTIDRHSWPLPVGASASTLQTPNYFMNNAADKVAAELAARKHQAR